MFEDFSHVVTYSKGLRNHSALKYFCGDKLCSAFPTKSARACFIGWGNKDNTSRARKEASQRKVPYYSLEDGFIRSVGLGVDGAESFSLVIDDLGIYYDATRPSRLERILLEHDFAADKELAQKAELAIKLIKEFRVSKYNAVDTEPDFFIEENDRQKILVIGQTAGDMSLAYGFGDTFSTNEMIQAACRENPESEIYVKIHPDVLAGKKKSDLDLKQVPQSCRLITEQVNPIALLEKFAKVYTKTSQMGFEALMLGKECVCFGMPFYAGWGITDDRVDCSRRERALKVSQVFSGAYVLYSRYFNPCLNCESDLIDTIHVMKERSDLKNRSDPIGCLCKRSLEDTFPHKPCSSSQVLKRVKNSIRLNRFFSRHK